MTQGHGRSRKEIPWSTRTFEIAFCSGSSGCTHAPPAHHSPNEGSGHGLRLHRKRNTMKPDLDSLIARARAQRVAAEPLGGAFNQHVWRQIRVSENRQQHERWNLGLLLSNPACGVVCLLLAVGIGVGFGINEAKRLPHTRVAHGDLSVFSAESPSLPSSLLHHP